MTKPCPCGSGKSSWWKHDARNIPLARVCQSCQADRLSKFRSDVLMNPNYYADEPIEGDSW